MYDRKKITNLPIGNILASGISFRYDRKTQGFRIEIGGESKWHFPKDFINDVLTVSSITADKFGNPLIWKESVFQLTFGGRHFYYLGLFLKSYMDTPRDKILDFNEDFCDLGDILKASDKRIGRYHLGNMLFKTNSPIARSIIHYRIRGKHVQT